ncbi:ABC transporter substrate-binding protein [Rugosimonospora acidiphila]|uniref:ABC transporter substrate-binding protein n=1 Tax=Rugosimonospora acidiphila TaxID=556531 RepID=A0ABP9SIS7_9ACTN
MKTKYGALVAGGAALVLALTACSGGGSSATTKPTGGSGSGYNAATKGVVNPSTKKGGTLKLVSDADADSYDPARTYYAWMWNFSRFYNRTLLTSAPAQGAASLKLVNDLAESQDISSDGLTYTYKLKSGVKFQDGTPITSKDIKYGIERIFAQDVLPGGPTYLKGILDEGQNYPGPYKDTSPDGLKSVTTPDDTTIVFKLASPFADFPYLLAMPGAGPVPKAKDTGAKYTNNPVASGPYEFKSYQPGKSLVLVRNPNWDPSTDSVRKALPDEIDLTIISDDNEIDNELLDGTADVNTAQTGVQSAAQAKILLDASLKANADDFFTGFTRYFSISSQVPPFNNINCRIAVQYAADKVSLQTARGGPEAGGAIAPSMIPPTVAGYDASLTPYTGNSGKPDIAKAKDYLSKCGQPNGFKTVIATQSTDKGEKVAQALQQALAKVNITATIDATDPSPYYSATIGTPSNVHKKNYGIMQAGWGADFPTGYGFLDVISDGRKIQQEGGNTNTGELNDPAINSLIDQAVAETDPTKAADIWKQVDAKTMDAATYLPFVFDKALNYRNPRLTNAYVDSYYGMLDFQALGVTK